MDTQNQLVNVVDPDTQEIGSIPVAQLQDAINMGYQQASQEQVEHHFKEQEFSTPGQMVATAAEGLLSGATLHASEPIEVALGLATPERIAARKEVNPAISTVSEIGGLVGSAALLPGAGAAGVLTRAGEAGATALGLGTAEGLIAKVGSAAVKGAIENAVFQGTDEAAKMFMGDPSQSVETALVNTGLAGLLGAGFSGAIGSVSPVWKATMGNKMGTWLEAVQRRLNGERAPLPENIRSALDEVQGLNDIYPAELRGAQTGARLADEFNNLVEARTTPGLKLKESVGEFQKDATNVIAETLRKNPEELLGKGELSHYEAGQQLQEKLAGEIERRFQPISEQYEKIADKFKDIPVTTEATEIADKLSTIANDEGWLMIKGSPQANFFNEVMDSLGNVKSLNDMRKYISNIWTAAKKDRSSLFYPARKITNELENVLEKSYLANAGAEGGEFLENFAKVKESYRAEKNLIEELNDRLHVGKFGGPDTFVRALREMGPETVASRLSKINDAGLLKLLNEQYPEIGQMVREYALNRALGPAVTKAAEGHALNAKVFFGALDNMTPEMRNFVLGEQAQKKLASVRTLLESVPKYQSSRTAGNLDKLWEKVPGSALAAVSMMLGHNPIAGWLIGSTAKWAARDAPDAARLAMLKFFGSDMPIEAGGFKAVMDFANQVVKGERTLNGVVSNLFAPGAQILPSKLIYTDEDHKRLDEKIEEIDQDPEKIVDSGGEIVHYGPEYGQSLAQTSGNAIQILKSLKPKPVKEAPLDSEPAVSKFEDAQYKQALKIAQSPLTVLQSIKDGTVTPQEVNLFKDLYPALYARTSTKIFEKMANRIQKGEIISYKTRLGLSLFLGEPLDSTMTQAGIASAQPPMPMPNAMAQPKGMGKPTQMGLGKLTPLGKTAMTMEQSSVFRTLNQRH